MRLRTSSRFLLILVVAATFSACASLRVNSYAERGFVASAYHTYAWAPEDRVSTGDPRLDNNPFFSDRVRGRVEQRLADRGFRKASGTPDVLLHYHASIGDRIDLSGTRDPYGNCDNCGASVYSAGTLVVDLVDARTTKLVWRGWAENVEPVVDKQEWMERTIDEVVDKIMMQLP